MGMERSTLLNGKPWAITGGVVASDGAVVFPDEHTRTYDWNLDGSLNYVEFTMPADPTVNPPYAGGTYRKTYSYVLGNISTASNWVLQ